MSESKAQSTVNELKDKDIGSLILKYAFPNIIGMLLFISYFIIIQIYIVYFSGLGTIALGGIGICMPIVILLMALSMLTGIGAASQISISLGKEDKETANNLLGNAITITVIIALVFIAIFLLFFKPILLLIGTTEETYPHVKDFLLIFVLGFIVSLLCFCLNNILRASGHPKKAVFLLLIGIIFATISIPLFSYLMNNAIKGSATGIVFSQFVVLIPILTHFLKKDSSVQLSMQTLKLKMPIVKLILKIGLSPFLVMFSVSFVAIIINNRLKFYGGHFAISTYTIVHNFITIFIFILSGLSQGIQPIIGYNFGAGKIKRVLDTVKIAGSSGIIIGIVGLIIAYFFSHPFISMFPINDDLVKKEAALCLKVVVISLPLSGFHLIITSFFQSIGSAGKAFLLSITRQWIFLVPALFIFPLYWQVKGIWYSLPFADALSAILAITVFILHLKIFKNKKLI